MSGSTLPIAVLISGNGSNLQAFIDAVAAGRLDAEIVAVYSDQPGAFGLERARRAGIATRVVPATGHADRESYDRALGDAIDTDPPGLVVLAGFMRILSPPFVRRYAGRMLNIHPSLLPAYRGLHTYRRVLEAGETRHGCSVHLVTEVLDGGPVVAQAVVPVRPGDDEAGLSARVQAREHKLYPLVAGWFAGGRLQVRDGEPWLDGERLRSPVRFEADEEIQ